MRLPLVLVVVAALVVTSQAKLVDVSDFEGVTAEGVTEMARSFFINDYYDDLIGCYFPDSFGAACNVTSDCGSDEDGILQCCSGECVSPYGSEFLNEGDACSYNQTLLDEGNFDENPVCFPLCSFGQNLVCSDAGTCEREELDGRLDNGCACDDDTDCQYRCEERTGTDLCLALMSRSVGDDCELPLDCSSANCTNDKCGLSYSTCATTADCHVGVCHLSRCRLESGSTCQDNIDECLEDDEWCWDRNGDDTEICSGQVAIGQNCTGDHQQCAGSSVYCHDGVCTKAEPGDECVAFTYVGAPCGGGYCNGTHCVASDSCNADSDCPNGRCHGGGYCYVIAAEGESCGGGEDCSDDQYCSNIDGKCHLISSIVRNQTVNGTCHLGATLACNWNIEWDNCAPGLACDLGTDQCVNQTCNSPEDCPESSACSGGQCKPRVLMEDGDECFENEDCERVLDRVNVYCVYFNQSAETGECGTEAERDAADGFGGGGPKVANGEPCEGESDCLSDYCACTAPGEDLVCMDAPVLNDWEATVRPRFEEGGVCALYTERLAARLEELCDYVIGEEPELVFKTREFVNADGCGGPDTDGDSGEFGGASLCELTEAEEAELVALDVASACCLGCRPGAALTGFGLLSTSGTSSRPYDCGARTRVPDLQICSSDDWPSDEEYLIGCDDFLDLGSSIEMSFTTTSGGAVSKEDVLAYLADVLGIHPDNIYDYEVVSEDGGSYVVTFKVGRDDESDQSSDDVETALKAVVEDPPTDCDTCDTPLFTIDSITVDGEEFSSGSKILGMEVWQFALLVGGGAVVIIGGIVGAVMCCKSKNNKKNKISPGGG